jgi:hypothetical protein
VVAIGCRTCVFKSVHENEAIENLSGQMKLQIQAVFRYLNLQSKKQNVAAIRLCFFVIDNYHRPQFYRPEL